MYFSFREDLRDSSLQNKRFLNNCNRRDERIIQIYFIYFSQIHEIQEEFSFACNKQERKREKNKKEDSCRQDQYRKTATFIEKLTCTEACVCVCMCTQCNTLSTRTHTTQLPETFGCRDLFSQSSSLTEYPTFVVLFCFCYLY